MDFNNSNLSGMNYKNENDMNYINENDRKKNSSSPPSISLDAPPSSPWLSIRTTKTRTLGITAVALITYFNVCGGPWGIEEVVSDAGPLPGIIGLAVFPLLWALPVALVTAELSSAYPDDGGYSLWVGEAFGEFWAFQESYWSWVSGVIDNALYPGLVYQLAVGLIFEPDDPLPNDPYFRYFNKLGLVIIFTIPNIFHVLNIGHYMKWITLFVIAPFIIFCIMCIPHLQPSRMWEPPPGGYPTTWNENKNGQSWSDLVTILYWNLSGFDCASTFAGEVVRPGRTFPLALLIALLLAFFTYAVPITLGVMATDPKDVMNWGTDPGECSWSCIVQNVSGRWLAVWVLLASIVGNMGMYIAEMFEDTWQLYGMADNGMAPAIFAKLHPKYKTPINGIIFSVILIAGLIYFDFSDNLAINNFFSCGSALLEMFAFIRLRFSKDNLYRPFKVPCGKIGVILALFIPICLGCLVLISGCMNSKQSFIMNMGGLIFGFLFYLFMKQFCGMKYEYDPRRKRLLSKDNIEPGENHEDGHRILPEIIEQEDGIDDMEEDHFNGNMFNNNNNDNNRIRNKVLSSPSGYANGYKKNEAAPLLKKSNGNNNNRGGMDYGT